MNEATTHTAKGGNTHHSGGFKGTHTDMHMTAKSRGGAQQEGSPKKHKDEGVEEDDDEEMVKGNPVGEPQIGVNTSSFLAVTRDKILHTIVSIHIL